MLKVSSVACVPPFHQILWKSVEFLHNLADKQMNKQTNKQTKVNENKIIKLLSGGSNNRKCGWSSEFTHTAHGWPLRLLQVRKM